jgi:DNA polymerase
MGYPIVLTVHDEIVVEAPDTPDYTADELSSILATQPAWAAGLPLAAKGFESKRYRKDD